MKKKVIKKPTFQTVSTTLNFLTKFPFAYYFNHKQLKIY